MAKPGIKILEETVGDGPVLARGFRVRLCYDVCLNGGECVVSGATLVMVVGDRECIAGLRYGLDGMRCGGTRRFKASPHLCYRDEEVGGIPKNAVLVFRIHSVEPAA